MKFGLVFSDLLWLPLNLAYLPYLEGGGIEALSTMTYSVIPSFQGDVPYLLRGISPTHHLPLPSFALICGSQNKRTIVKSTRNSIGA